MRLLRFVVFMRRVAFWFEDLELFLLFREGLELSENVSCLIVDAFFQSALMRRKDLLALCWTAGLTLVL